MSTRPARVVGASVGDIVMQWRSKSWVKGVVVATCIGLACQGPVPTAMAFDDDMGGDGGMGGGDMGGGDMSGWFGGIGDLIGGAMGSGWNTGGYPQGYDYPYSYPQQPMYQAPQYYSQPPPASYYPQQPAYQPRLPLRPRPNVLPQLRMSTAGPGPSAQHSAPAQHGASTQPASPAEPGAWPSRHGEPGPHPGEQRPNQAGQQYREQPGQQFGDAVGTAGELLAQAQPGSRGKKGCRRPPQQESAPCCPTRLRRFGRRWLTTSPAWSR